jgi:tRNA threonylcarbamoyladenosine biosynthesis protein TsaE
MVTSISHIPDETAAIGESWGRTAVAGQVIGLCGDLGAGKTQLVKGLAKGLDIAARVHSPTFALVNIYTGGRLTLCHLDLYRLNSAAEIQAAGLEEFLRPAGVTVIEWAEKWFGDRPQSHARELQTDFPALLRWVRIESMGETDRRISYEDIGA